MCAACAMHHCLPLTLCLTCTHACPMQVLLKHPGVKDLYKYEDGHILDLAAMSGHEKMVQYLLAENMPVGANAMAHAAHYNHTNIMSVSSPASCCSLPAAGTAASLTAATAVAKAGGSGSCSTCLAAVSGALQGPRLGLSGCKLGIVLHVALVQQLQTCSNGGNPSSAVAGATIENVQYCSTCVVCVFMGAAQVHPWQCVSHQLEMLRSSGSSTSSLCTVCL